MANIAGNITGVIQTKKSSGKNKVGEADNTWSNTFNDVHGWLDLQNGDSKRTNFNAKIEESTHVFLMDFDAGIYALTDDDQDVRMIIKGKMYDVLLIDNPMEMDEQLEIYLRKIGGQNGRS